MDSFQNCSRQFRRCPHSRGYWIPECVLGSILGAGLRRFDYSFHFSNVNSCHKLPRVRSRHPNFDHEEN